MKAKQLKFLIIIFASIPALFVASKVEALPDGVPGKLCGTLSNPSPGDLCYTITPGGGKASAGGGTREFSTIIQATEPEYVIADVVIEVLDGTGDRSTPTKQQISPGGTASQVSVATNKLRELKQIKMEVQAKAEEIAKAEAAKAEAAKAKAEAERNATIQKGIGAVGEILFPSKK